MNRPINLLTRRIAPRLRLVQSSQQANMPIITGTRTHTYQQGTRSFHQSALLHEVKTVKVTFIDPLEKEIVVDAEVGKHLLDIAHDNNIELEGACGGGEH